jgi:hypothetical protein
MSRITDIILTTMLEDGGDEDEHPNVALLNDHLRSKGEGSLNKVSESAGGNRGMQCDVFIAANNYMDTQPFIDKFKSIKWEWPESAQLFIKEEEDDFFTIHVIDEKLTK